jgi:hypothetical protein
MRRNMTGARNVTICSLSRLSQLSPMIFFRAEEAIQAIQPPIYL